LFFARAATCAILIASTSFKMIAEDKSPAPRRDINEVLRAHDKELLALPGVVGVYVSVLEDGKTPCLKVMLRDDSARTAGTVPKTLEDYPVVLEVTGEVRPLGK
jgi:multidrug efflux pump subunit AcrA (membrane-fusion protein)